MGLKRSIVHQTCTLIIWAQLLIGFTPTLQGTQRNCIKSNIQNKNAIQISENLTKALLDIYYADEAYDFSDTLHKTITLIEKNKRIKKDELVQSCLEMLIILEEIQEQYPSEYIHNLISTIYEEIGKLGISRSPRPANPLVTTNPLAGPVTTFVIPRDVSIERDFNVDGATHLNDLSITGSIKIPDFRADNITLTEEGGPACLIYQGPTVEKARICSSGIAGQKGVSISIDGGTTKQWEIDNNGDVQISSNLFVSGIFQPNSLVVQSSAAVNGPTSLQATTINGHLNVKSSTYFDNGVPGVPAQILQVTKGTISGPNQFNSIKAAIDSITDASATKPYIIQVGAGLYTEDTITMKPYVGVAGDSSSATRIEVDAPSKDVLIGAPNASISNIRLQGATDLGKAAIVYNGGGSFQVSNCSFGDNNIIANEQATVGPTCELTMRACVISGNAIFERALNLEANSGIKGLMIVNNLFWTADTNPSLNEFALFSGPDAEAFFITSRITSDTTLTGDGFVAQNGAFFSLETSEFGGFNRALYVPNVGTGPEVRVGSVSTSNDTIDLQIDNPTTIATIEGVFDKDKIIIDDSVTNLSLSTLNPSTGGSISVGPQFWADQYKNITDTSPQIEFGSNLGVISGGILSDAGGLNVAISSGTGYLMRTDNTLKYITWNTVPTLTIPANSEGFISVNEAGIAQFSTSPPNVTQAIEIGKVRTDATDIIYIQLIKQEADHSATQIDNTLREALGSIYSAGSLVAKNGNTQLDVTSGRYFYSTHEYTPSGGSPISWQAFYRNGGAGGYTNLAQTNIDYQRYDNGTGTLASIPANNFARHALYIVNDGANEKYLMQYAQQTYATLLDAQNGVIPPKPGTWTGNITLISSIIVENTGVAVDQIAEIRDERPTLGFKASGVSVVTNHGSLSGLLNDDHPQYLLTNGSRTVTGALNMGTNNITNVGQVNGVTVESHAARHLPNGADPLTTTAPVNIGTTNQEGIQNSFARSDHIHNHGNLAGGSLHADATTTIAGFMSATDKTKLDNINTEDFVQKSGDTMTGTLNINATGSNALIVNTNKLLVENDTGNTTIAGTTTINSLSTGVVHSNASGLLTSSPVVDADIDPTSNVAIGAQAANDATEANIANRIVKRDASGNFIAGTITASLIGNATSADSTINFSGSLSGDVTGTQNSTVVAAVGGQSAANVATGTQAANNATESNTANTIVKRDASGNFAAGTITANLSGNATTATSAGSFSGNLAGDVTGPQAATVVNTVGGKTATQISTSVNETLAATNLNTANTIIKRDASGNFTANTITANLSGNATTATSADSFTGNLAGDVTGPQGTTVVEQVGGQTAANVATGTQAANNATSANAGNRIIERDASGNFAANIITADLSGNATTATSAGSFTGNLAGDVTGPQAATVVAQVGGQSAANIATGTTAANAATSTNTTNTIVERDASGNFAANTITADLSGNATTATSFTGSLTGDVTGTQTTTSVQFVGGQSATNIATGTQAANNATENNTINTIVKRDNSGNFSAGTITATLDGSASSAGTFTGSLSGDVTGTQAATVVAQVGGQTAANVATGTQAANNATSTNTGNRIVERDASGNFAANIITADLSGNATTATSAGSFTGNLAGDVTGPQAATVVAQVGGQSAANIATGTTAANAATSTNIANTIVERDVSGNFSAGTITASLNGNATTATVATNFSGSLSGDVTGTQGSTTVSTVGGKTAAQISTSVDDTLAATNLNTASTIVKRDASGNFSAGTITANITGSASSNVLKTGDTMTGSLTLSGASTDLTVGGSTDIQDLAVHTTSYFDLGVPGIPAQILQVTKGALSGPNQFNSVKTAVDSITDASATKPYIIQVAPGIYTEDTVTMKQYVAVVGDSSSTTFIEVDATSKDIIIGAPNSSISNIKLRGATDAGKAAIVYNGGGTFQISNCGFGANDRIVNQIATTGPECNLVMRACVIDATSNFSRALNLEATSGIPGLAIVNNLFWIADNNPNLTEFAVFDGADAQAFFITSRITSATTLTGDGFVTENGALLSLQTSEFGGFAKALNVPNVGTGPELRVSSVFVTNNTVDVQLDNPNTNATIEGAFELGTIDPTDPFGTKVVIDNSITDLSLFMINTTSGETIAVGEQFSGDTAANVTNISPQIQEGSSLGVISGGELSAGAGLQVNVTAGTGYISNPVLKYLVWNAGSLALPANTDSYIYIDATGTLTSATSEPDEFTTILIGKARTDASNIVFVQLIKREAEHTATQLDESWRLALGSIYNSGSLVSKNGTLQLDVSSGRYFFSTHEFNPTGGTAISWEAFYRNGSGNYTITNQNTMDYNHYDDGSGTLALIPANNFARHALYIVNDGAAEKYLLVYAHQTYTTLIDAENGVIPPEPGTWTDNITLIASIIVENTAVTADRIAEIRDERPTLGFKASGVSVVTVHGDLSGLLADDHPQYLLTDGSRTLTGDLNMGGQNITNVNLVDGVNVPAHASRHLPNGADPLTTAAPLSISTSNQEGVANSFARSDHIHNHGNLAGGTLHSAATTTVAGFMSAADKTLLDSINPANFVQKSGDTMTGTLNINATGSNALVVNTNKLIVDNNTGNTTIGGTLNVTGTTTLSSLGAGIVHSNVSGILTSSLIVDADVDPAAGIVDTKLATISTAGKVANSATTATDSNTINTIVLRNGSGNFSAGTITATLDGSATSFSGSLAGDVTGTQGATTVALVGGKTAAQVSTSVDDTLAATNLNTVSTIVKRDASGNFSAGTITANLDGNATSATTATNATNFTGALSGDVTGTQGATVVSAVGGQTAADVANATQDVQNATSANNPNTLVERDISGNFSAGTITASLNGNAATATVATNFSGSLAGDVTGTQGATTVALVGGKTSAQVSTSVDDTLAATDANTPSTIVKRDGSGNFSAGTITANLDGSATNFSGSLSGDVTGTQGATTVALVGGKTAAQVSTSVDDTLAATNLNTVSTIVKRDASGNFSAGTITANLDGNATSATTATNATNFTGALSGDVTGTQGATVVSAVGGQTAADVASATQDVQNATSANNPNTLVERDISGNFSAGTITASLNGNAATATVATNFSGPLAGDVTGTQGATTVALVGGKTSAQVSTSVDDTLAATDANTPSTIVKRDISGNFSAGTITANLTGTATNATTTVNFSGSLTGDVIGTQGATVVDKVSGKDAAEVATSVDDTQAATNLNTPSTIVKRDASGNFVAGNITANLTGTATNATTAVNFTGTLAGNVSGTQGATVVDSVGGKTSAEIATSVNDTQAATNLNTASTIVKRDASGNFSAGTISGAFSGNLTGNVTGNLTGSASDNVLKAGDTMTGNLTMDNQQEIRLREQTVSGTNYLAMRAPTALATDYTLTWPINAGASNQVLATDGTGNLSWISPSSGVSTTNVKAAAYMGSNTTFPADTTITVPFDTEHFDPNNNFNTASHTYTAPTTGYYNYCVQISADTINNFDYRVDIVINGTPATGYGMRFRRADVPITLTNYILLTAGDIVRIDFTGNGGDTVYANDTNFSIHLISI